MKILATLEPEWPPRWRVRLEWKLEDLWVGVFWRRETFDRHNGVSMAFTVLEIWVCLLPCLPVHLQFFRSAKHRGDFD